VFAISGATQASWMSRLPAILDRTHSDLVRLGLAFFLLGVGTLAAMVLTAPACDRYGGPARADRGPRRHAARAGGRRVLPVE
jgi:hypothetical protein